jgi:hypothetical protein
MASSTEAEICLSGDQSRTGGGGQEEEGGEHQENNVHLANNKENSANAKPNPNRKFKPRHTEAVHITRIERTGEHVLVVAVHT